MPPGRRDEAVRRSFACTHELAFHRSEYSRAESPHSWPSTPARTHSPGPTTQPPESADVREQSGAQVNRWPSADSAPATRGCAPPTCSPHRGTVCTPTVVAPTPAADLLSQP